MDIRDRRALKEEASLALSQASYQPQKLVLLHSAILSGAGLLILLLDLLLAQQIEQTGGLGGMELRAVFSTIQSVLQLTLSVVTPFWMMGLTYIVLRFARQQTTGPQDLTAGLRRFGPVLRLMLLRIAVYSGVAILALNISSMLFYATPLSFAFQDVVAPALESSDPNALNDPALLNAAIPTLIPLFVIFGIVFGALAIPLTYRFRLADYLIMDEERPGALRSLLVSGALMRRYRFQMFRLDLSFWWYFLLQALLIALAYGDTLLPALGVTLPMSGEAAFVLFYVLYLLGQLALYWRFGAQVETTYAVAYEHLRKDRYPAQPPQPPVNPWNNQV